ncbi:tricalbin [Suhomyces tanzawaensis NRRL Y-17324]|uniref:Tricalbin n=1 Tax=Suhomyces tanzawaensis NRRL Y-17324 TaxID=984487 RepID=A0A1E4SBL8_9ASCO|nr:tricalbin [Suhomyces tanzawaensis NRRL Y-17324]ODV76904.1 tricalbin [Suhomyces tanzawaensis NRRL Y-17324]
MATAVKTTKGTNPNEVLQPPEQVQVEPHQEIDKRLETEEQKIDVNGVSVSPSLSTIDLTPSEDLDVSEFTVKPPAREAGEPTYRGWKEVGRWTPEDALTFDDELVDLLTKSTIFDKYLPSVAYGDWYHNAGYLIVGGLLSWLIGWFRFSMAPLFFVIVSFSLLYRSSVRKYRSVLREQAQREFSIKSIENDYETMDWLNTFLEKFWVFLEPSIAQIVCDQVNPILAASPAPAFVKSLWIDSFTAGTKPPRIDTVKTLHGTNDDIVVMDWGFSFTPSALTDTTTKQMKNKVNQKVVVKASLFGLTIPVAVSDVSVRGLARVRLRMMSSFPHVETVNVSLLEPPHIDFTSRVLGESIFNWEVLGFPGLYPFINEMIKKYVGAILFTPLSFQLNVQQLLAGNALDSSIGVLAVTVNNARRLKGFNGVGNTLDPYITIGFTNKVLAKSTIKKDTDEATWNETYYIPVVSLSEPLNLAVIDYNEYRKDRQVGSIQFDLECLLENDKQPNLSAPFIRNNKPVGELNFGLQFMPTIEPENQADGAVIPPPDLNTGIVRIEVIEARHLKSSDDKGASTYAEAYIGNEKVISTGVQKNTNNPGWGASHEHIIYNRAKSKVKVAVKDKSNKIIGRINLRLNELIDATQVEQTWFPLSKGGEVRITGSWKPVGLVDASGAGGYSPPIGTVRLSIDKADDLRNLEHIGKVDPYARVLVNGFQRSRTAAVESTLNPTWNEIHYFTVSSPNQKLTIDVMDVEAHSPDRTLGSFDVKLTEIISKNEKGEYVEYIDTEKRESKLIHKKGPKGTVTYSLSFYPTLPVKTLQDIKEEEEEKEEREKARKAKEKEKANSAPAGFKEDTKQEENVKGDDKTKKDQPEDDEDEEQDKSKLELSLDELMEYKSGVLIFEMIHGSVSRENSYLQVFFDNHGHCDYASEKLTRRDQKLGKTGDVIIKELEWSKAHFRLVKDKEANRLEKAIAETTIPTLQLLKNGYHEPTTIDLSGGGSFKLQCSWVPIIYESEIPPQDSINNSGNAKIEVVRAENLIAGDRNGKSDPYVELYLNTDKDYFFKSKKVKKTLDPVWNESTTVEVINKYDSFIKVVVYDWDMGPEQDDLLGYGSIKLSDVPTDGSEVELSTLIEGENGEDGGAAFFKVSFKPEFILNVRPGSGTHIGDAFGHVGHVGVGAGKGVVKGVGTVGKGLGGGVKALRKGLHLGGKDKDK